MSDSSMDKGHSQSTKRRCTSRSSRRQFSAKSQTKPSSHSKSPRHKTRDSPRHSAISKQRLTIGIFGPGKKSNPAMRESLWMSSGDKEKTDKEIRSILDVYSSDNIPSDSLPTLQSTEPQKVTAATSHDRQSRRKSRNSLPRNAFMTPAVIVRQNSSEQKERNVSNLTRTTLTGTSTPLSSHSASACRSACRSGGLGRIPTPVSSSIETFPSAPCMEEVALKLISAVKLDSIFHGRNYFAERKTDLRRLMRQNAPRCTPVKMNIGEMVEKGSNASIHTKDLPQRRTPTSKQATSLKQIYSHQSLKHVCKDTPTTIKANADSADANKRVCNDSAISHQHVCNDTNHYRSEPSAMSDVADRSAQKLDYPVSIDISGRIGRHMTDHHVTSKSSFNTHKIPSLSGERSSETNLTSEGEGRTVDVLYDVTNDRRLKSSHEADGDHASDDVETAPRYRSCDDILSDDNFNALDLFEINNRSLRDHRPAASDPDNDGGSSYSKDPYSHHRFPDSQNSSGYCSHPGNLVKEPVENVITEYIHGHPYLFNDPSVYVQEPVISPHNQYHAADLLDLAEDDYVTQSPNHDQPALPWSRFNRRRSWFSIDNDDISPPKLYPRKLF